MTVTVTKIGPRDMYAVNYEGSTGEGMINALITNPATGDASNYVGKNDGNFVVSVGVGYAGEAEFEVNDPQGHTIDSGLVQFGQDVPPGEIPPDTPVGDPGEHPAHPISLPDNPDQPHVEPVEDEA